MFVSLPRYNCDILRGFSRPRAAQSLRRGDSDAEKVNFRSFEHSNFAVDRRAEEKLAGVIVRSLRKKILKLQAAHFQLALTDLLKENIRALSLLCTFPPHLSQLIQQR